MLFAGDDGPRAAALLLTERAHHMRSHPGQVSFPGGSIDPARRRSQAALREAEEETGLDPAGVEVFGELPELWLPPSNFAVTPVLGWWRDPVAGRGGRPRRGARDPPGARSPSCCGPTTAIGVRHPSGWVGPAFLIGPDRDVILWGFTAGVDHPALRLPRLGHAVGRLRGP